MDENGYDGKGIAGEAGCGARIELSVAFEDERVAKVRYRAEGASTAEAAARSLAEKVRGATWREAASVTESEVAVATGAAGPGGRHACPPDKAALFAVDALHRAFEDALRNDRFPRAAGRSDRSALVAMSGGVDSSVACLLSKRSARLVTGVTMRLWSDPDQKAGAVSCCSPESVIEARRICHSLGLPHVTIDCASEFEESVVGHFVEEYLRGRTPNPCTRCNAVFRFPLLDRLAARLGAGRVVTGHYARIVESDEATEGLLIARGRDRGKDQSYVLWGIDPGLLAGFEFPLGGLLKRETRQMAAAAGLSSCRRPESQEICFIPDDDYRRFLRSRADVLPGPGDIVDAAGTVLGRHGSIVDFTIGQRKGLGISAPAPLYVLDTDVERDRVVVGPREGLYVDRLEVMEANTFVPPGAVRDCHVQVRYNALPVAANCSLHAGGEAATVLLKEPVAGVAPGQSAVFYEGELLLAGGVIAATAGGH